MKSFYQYCHDLYFVFNTIKFYEYQHLLNLNLNCLSCKAHNSNEHLVLFKTSMYPCFLELKLCNFIKSSDIALFSRNNLEWRCVILAF